MDSSYLQFATLETIRGMVPRFVPQLFLGWLLGTRRSAIGQFFSVPSKFQKSLRKSTRPLSSFLKWQIKPFFETCAVMVVGRGLLWFQDLSKFPVSFWFWCLSFSKKRDGIDCQDNYALKTTSNFIPSPN